METNKLRSELAGAFLEYGEHAQPDLPQSCALALNLKRVLGMCQRLEGLPRWVREGRLALERFELQLTSQAKAEWKALLDSNGIDYTLKVVEGGKVGQVDLNAEMDGALAVLKQGKTLSDLSSFSLESATLVQKAKHLLTVSSLGVEQIKFFFPDVMETVSNFKAQVTKMVVEGLEQISATTKPSDVQKSLFQEMTQWHSQSVADLEDLRMSVAKTCCCCTAAEAVVNHENYDKDYLGTARSISAYMTKVFGISTQDLPDNLRRRFEAFSQGKLSAEPATFGNCLVL
eukprot:s4337_g7.t1